MLPLAKNLLLISIAIAMLLSVLMQSACHKDANYISQKDFINILKGEWYVSWYSCESPDNTFHMIARYDDSLHCFTYVGSEEHEITFSTDDSIFCTFPELEYMQYWTITENKKDLFLETADLCGVTKNYEIDYSNYEYSIFSKDLILANIKLVSADALITTIGFTIYTNNDVRIEFEYDNWENDFNSSCHLNRP